jgi:beta-lactamase regulating signal transducer with metallopeptidase domain
MIGALLGYLADAAWQVPLLALAAAILSRWGGLGPRGRNLLWLACLGLAVALPALHLTAPVAVSAAAPAASATVDPAAIALNSIDASAPPAVVAETASPRFQLSLDSRWAEVLAVGFGLIVLAGLVRLATGWLAVRRLVRRADALDLPPAVAAELERVAASRRRSAPSVRQTPRIASPVAAGVVVQTILAPQGLADRPEDEVRAALLHELAHVLRRDYAVNLLAELVSLPIAWHPATHLIKAEIRRTRELACDAMASAAMRSGRVYAQNLLSLARAVGPQTRTPSPMLVGLFGKPSLEERLMHLIGPKRPARPALIVTGAAAALGLVTAAALLHVPTALAEAAAAPPAPPTVAPVPPRPPAALPDLPALPAPPAAPAPAHAIEAAPAVAAVPAERAVPAVPAIPAIPAAPAVAAEDAHDDIVLNDGGRYRHQWTTAAGKTLTVYTDDPNDPSPAERAKIERKVAKAMEKAAKAMAMVNSPEFKAKIAHASEEAARAATMANSAEFKAKIAAAQAEAARAQAMVDSPEFKARIAHAADAAARAQARIDSPAFRARLAEIQSKDVARLAKLEALKALDDPKIKAEIDRARRAQDSPEFRKAMDDLAKATAELRALKESDKE